MVGSFLEFMGYCQPLNKNSSKYESTFVVDCANGVCSNILRSIDDRISEHIKLTLINARSEKNDSINERCGPQYVFEEKLEPVCYTETMPDKVVSISSDGGRLVYWKRSANSKSPIIMNGEKTFSILAEYIIFQLESVGIGNCDHMVIITPFANSKCRAYLETNMISTICIPGGQREAEPEIKKHIISIYCEPNG